MGHITRRTPGESRPKFCSARILAPKVSILTFQSLVSLAVHSVSYKCTVTLMAWVSPAHAAEAVAHSSITSRCPTVPPAAQLTPHFRLEPRAQLQGIIWAEPPELPATPHPAVRLHFPTPGAGRLKSPRRPLLCWDIGCQLWGFCGSGQGRKPWGLGGPLSSRFPNNRGEKTLWHSYNSLQY